MTRAKAFRSPTEVRLERPEFDEQCKIGLADFASLVGAYTFPEKDTVRCQILVDGSPCKQPHQNGWIAKRKDGAEGYIGRVCARRHFKADETFAREARRVELEIEIDNLVSRLRTMLGDPSLVDVLADARERIAALRVRLRTVREDVPKAIWKRLEDMLKTGNAVVTIEVRYVEKDERGKPKYSFIPDNLGYVSGLSALDSGFLSGRLELIEAAEQALQQARPNQDESRKDLRGWVEALERVPTTVVEIGEIEADLELFLRPENLRLLAYLSRVEVEREAIVTLISNLAGGEGGTSPHLTLRAWDAEIRRARGDRDFR
jgi:hypothetical protein